MTTEFEADVEAAEVPNDDKLRRIATMAERLVALTQEAEDLETALAAKHAELKLVEETDLPNAMREAGMLDFTLVDGSKLALKTDYYASIAKKRANDAFSWLRSRGHGAIIKRAITAALPVDTDAFTADRLMTWVRANVPNVIISDKEAVHGGTLKAFLREQIRLGAIMEDDEAFKLLGGFTRRYAAVTLPDGTAVGAKTARKTKDEDEE